MIHLDDEALGDLVPGYTVRELQALSASMALFAAIFLMCGYALLLPRLCFDPACLDVDIYCHC